MSMSEPSPSKPLVVVSVFLFGKPACEIEGLEGSPVDIELLGAIALCGQTLNRRLARAAEVGQKLVAGGWEGYGLQYALEFYKTLSLREAGQELVSLGIGPGEVSVREEGEDSS